MVPASTRLAAAECDSVTCAICDSRTTVLPSPTEMSPERRHLADGLTGPGRVEFDVGEPAPDLDQLTGVVRAEDFDPPLALIAGCSVQHMSHSCRLSRCLTSHLPTTLQQMMHTGCIRGVTPGPC